MIKHPDVAAIARASAAYARNKRSPDATLAAAITDRPRIQDKP